MRLDVELVAPRLQCANRPRRAPQGSLTRAVFLLGAGAGDCVKSHPAASVRVVGREDGRGPDHLLRAPPPRLGGTTVTVRQASSPEPAGGLDAPPLRDLTWPRVLHLRSSRRLTVWMGVQMIHKSRGKATVKCLGCRRAVNPHGYLDHLASNPDCFPRGSLNLPECVHPDQTMHCGFCSKLVRAADLRSHTIEVHSRYIPVKIRARLGLLSGRPNPVLPERIRARINANAEAAPQPPPQPDNLGNANTPAGPAKHQTTPKIARNVALSTDADRHEALEESVRTPLMPLARQILEARRQRRHQALVKSFEGLMSFGITMAARNSTSDGPEQSLGLVEPTPSGLVVADVLLPEAGRSLMLGGERAVWNHEQLPLRMMSPGVRWIRRVQSQDGWHLVVETGKLPPKAELANQWGEECGTIDAIIDFDQRMYADQSDITAMSLHSMPPGLRLGVKSTHPVAGTRAFFSLWHDYRLVFQVKGKMLRFLHCERANEPLSLAEVSIRDIRRIQSAYARASITGLADGEFCTDSGRVMPARLIPYAVNVFHAVEYGQRLLGTGELHDTEHTHGTPRLPAESHDRPWSQAFLAGLHPSDSMIGELVGSGDRYVAFWFNRVVVVEYDDDAHATYLFDAMRFEDLREWPRIELIAKQPPGYKGRIIHRGAPAEWKTAVARSIARLR